MRKHPLIALIAFTFVAASMFIGAAGASRYQLSTCARHFPSQQGRKWLGGCAYHQPRWLAATVRERASATAQLTAQVARREVPALLAGPCRRPCSHSRQRRARQRACSRRRGASCSNPTPRGGSCACCSCPGGRQPSTRQLKQRRQHKPHRPRRRRRPHKPHRQHKQLRRHKQPRRHRAAQAATRQADQDDKNHEGTPTARPPGARGPDQPPVEATSAVFGWSCRLCESGNNYAEDTGNGYYGAYQFALGTWWGLGYSGLPSDASPAVQDQAAERLQAEAGWGQWPACSAELGL